MTFRSLFELEQASYRYGNGVMALCEVDLSIREGERVAILGATRSGKTTLLKIFQGQLAATAGRVQIFGQSYPPGKGRMRQDRRSRIGFSGPHPNGQLFRPTVLDDLIYGGAIVDVPLATSKDDFQSLCVALEIEDLLDRSFAELSGGEKKIVSIAAALLGHPEVFIMDGLSPGLSAYFKQRIVWLLTKSAFAPRTLLLATHDLALAESLCERAILLSPDHRKAADGPIRTIVQDTDLLVANQVIPGSFASLSARKEGGVNMTVQVAGEEMSPSSETLP
jgi:cobalt/nickel transport system ATP-binding protein